MNMTLQYYNQPHITVEEQIQLLKSEGLSFENESRAKHLLNHISMFRLKSYLKPFRQHNSRCFKSGATFEQAYVPRRTRLPFVTIPSDTKKVYYVLSIILYLLQTINPNNTFVTRFKSLLAKYPSVDVTAMGFPSGNWQDEPLWSTQS